MASIISAIKTQLLTDLETTSIEQAYDALVSECTGDPFAMMYIGAANTDVYMTQVYDQDYTITIEIIGHTAEKVDLAIEDTINLWYSSAKLAVLRALGVITILPTGSQGPFGVNGRDSGVVSGTLTFDMRVRYTP